MSSGRLFNSFQVAVFKTHQSINKAITMEEARSLGRRLNLTGQQVRNWFHRNDKKRIEMAEVAPDVQESIDKILNEVREEMKNVRRIAHRNKQLPSSMKSYQDKVLETRFRQSSNISMLECHLIGQHFDLEGESIHYWISKRRHSEKEDNPNFVICPKILELLNNINKEIDEHYRFNMTNSQEIYLKQRFSIDTDLPREERIEISKRIGVPDYWIKWWFTKWNRAERRKQRRADFAFDSSDSDKETQTKRVSEPSSVKKVPDIESMSQSEGWFKNMDILKTSPKGKTSPKASQPSFSRKKFQRTILETRFRQNSVFSRLEYHLIGRHFDKDGTAIEQWFTRRKHSRKEPDPNFEICPKVLEFLDNIKKEVKEMNQFKMADTQVRCLEQRFLIGSRLSRQERIAMSKRIGVPDYWIKWWFKRRIYAERQRMDRAALASNSSDNRKPASEPFDSDAQSNSDEWFENMATIPDSSEIFVPGETFPIPSSSQVTIERISKPASALEPIDSKDESISEDWFENMATVPETAELFLPVELFSFPTSSQVTTSTVMSLNFQRDNVSSAAQQSINQYLDSPIPTLWSPSTSYAMVPAPRQPDFSSSQAIPFQFD